jgi:hypothetical protein
MSEHKADEDQFVDMDADFEEEDEDVEDVPPDVGLAILLCKSLSDFCARFHQIQTECLRIPHHRARVLPSLVSKSG